MVWPLYLALFVGIMLVGSSDKESALRRLKMLALGFTVLCLGCGRMLWWADPAGLPEYDWLFTLGHWSLAAFTALYLYSAVHYRKTGEWL